MKAGRVTFDNKEGQKLSARIDLPLDRDPIGFAIFAHCFTCTKNLRAVGHISKSLTNNGYGVLRFDFTGLGESEGDFEDTNFSTNISDLVYAAEFLNTDYVAPSLIVGHSLGGAAVIFAASQIDSIQAVATVGAPCSPGHVSHLFDQNIDEIEEDGEAEVMLQGRPFKVKKQFLDDIKSKNMEKVLSNLKKPILIMHSPEDNTVGIENASQLYTLARHPKSFVSLSGADHLLSRAEDSQYVGEVIAGWASRYIVVDERKKLKPKSKVLASIGSTGYTTDIQSGNHYWRADEPLSVGGDDYGPNPYDLLLSGLGACTAMTMRMYADRKGWEIEEINVHLKHSRIHAKDCADCTSESGYIDKITKEIEILADLNEEQLNKLMEIAEKCPVNRTLKNEITTESILLS